MNKQFLSILGVLSVASGGTLFATGELRSPISLYHGYMHYPLDPIDDDSFAWETWKSFYARSADEAFSCFGSSSKCRPCPGTIVDAPTSCSTSCSTACSTKCDDGDKVTTRTTPLTQLFFGKTEFRGEEAFADGMQIVPNNPWMSFAKLSPRFDYNEWGSVFGVHIRKDFGCDRQWHFGARASIPFKIIEVECNCCAQTEETLDDVMKTSFELIDDPNNPALACATPPGGEYLTQVTYAYRLDFLTSLLRASSGNMPLVTFGDGSSDTTIGPVVVSDSSLDPAFRDAYLIRSDDRSIPEPPCHRNNSENCAGSYILLQADGSGGNDGSVLFFGNEDYADGIGQDRDAQSQLFLIPASEVAAGPIHQLTQGGQSIQQAVNAILSTLDTTGKSTAVGFFERECCIILCDNERTVGFGDLDTEFYVGYHPDNYYYVDGLIGFRFPTAERNCDPRRVLFQPRGNNGHVEARVGLQGGWRPRDCFAFSADLSYSRAIGRTEKRAAAFKGATIINVGPTVNAEVSWGYVVGHLDFTFFHPENRDLGCHIGYELYAKQKDCVRFCTPTAEDCLGNEHDLDACLLEAHTNRQTHKVRTEVFHRFYYWELFAGGSHIFAGKNSMKETEWHIGFNIWF